MANHMEIFTFCLFYLICFTGLFSLTPLGTFPPRDIVFALPGITIAGVVVLPPAVYDLPWVNFLAVMGISVLFLIILIAIMGNVHIAVFSWDVNTKYLTTVLVGFIVAGGLGVSMIQMMPPDMPLLAQFFLVWMWIVLLVYSIVMYAGAGSAGT